MGYFHGLLVAYVVLLVPDTDSLCKADLSTVHVVTLSNVRVQLSFGLRQDRIRSDLFRIGIGQD